MPQYVLDPAQKGSLNLSLSSSYFPIQNPRLIVTAVCGPSLSMRSTSFVGLPIRNVPGGMNTMFVGAANTSDR